MISIVIPAHNEAAVIHRTLHTLLDGARPGEFEVLVVPNGCTDDTAEVARGFGPEVRVIELERGSKPLALNTGDAEAAGFPRFFIDADIRVSAASVRAVATVLKGGEALAAAPALRIDTSGASLAVRMYYAIWTRLPYVTDAMIGSGVYAVSESGRGRFQKFPDIIGDDAFIRMLFDVGERASVSRDGRGDPVEFVVAPPRGLRSLVHIEVRRRASHDEMVELFGDRAISQGASQKAALRRMFARPWLWPALAVYVYVKLESRRRYTAKKSKGTHKVWNRDNSSRHPSSREGSS